MITGRERKVGTRNHFNVLDVSKLEESFAAINGKKNDRISSFSRLHFFLINICSAVSSDFGVLAKGGKLKVLLLWYFKPFPTICFFAKLLVDSWAFYSLLMISRSEEPFVKFAFPIKKFLKTIVYEWNMILLSLPAYYVLAVCLMLYQML